jgi:hypothetical protein
VNSRADRGSLMDVHCSDNHRLWSCQCKNRPLSAKSRQSEVPTKIRPIQCNSSVFVKNVSASTLKENMAILGPSCDPKAYDSGSG